MPSDAGESVAGAQLDKVPRMSRAKDCQGLPRLNKCPEMGQKARMSTRPKEAFSGRKPRECGSVQILFGQKASRVRPDRRSFVPCLYRWSIVGAGERGEIIKHSLSLPWDPLCQASTVR